MRSFIISLILFLCLLGIIFFNNIYVNRTAREITRLLSLTSIEDDTSEQMDSLLSYWERHRAFLSLSVSLREIDKAQELFIALRYAYETKNAYDFEKTKELIYDTAEDLARLEGFSIENIL